MPQKVSEEKEGRIAYEAMVRKIMDKCNQFLQKGSPRLAYLTLRDLYTSLIKRHRQKWMEQIDENYEDGESNLDSHTAKQMLSSRKLIDHWLNSRNHKLWMSIKTAFTDMCHDQGLFFHSRQVEVGHE
jgi:hypothetical protein